MSDVDRLKTAIKKENAAWYVGDAPSNKGEKDTTLKTLREINTSCPECNVMIMSADTEQLCIAARIVAENCPFGAEAWIQSCGVKKTESDDNVFFAIVKRDIATELFPIKFAETARGLAFAFLRKHKMLVEEENSDDDDEQAMLAMEL